MPLTPIAVWGHVGHRHGMLEGLQAIRIGILGRWMLGCTGSNGRWQALE